MQLNTAALSSFLVIFNANEVHFMNGSWWAPLVESIPNPKRLGTVIKGTKLSFKSVVPPKALYY